MTSDLEGRNSSFSTGAKETKYPGTKPIKVRSYTADSVFDLSQVRGSSNGLSRDDYARQRVGGGAAPSLNGVSASTYDKRLWIDKNPHRMMGG